MNQPGYSTWLYLLSLNSLACKPAETTNRDTSTTKIRFFIFIILSFVILNLATGFDVRGDWYET